MINRGATKKITTIFILTTLMYMGCKVGEDYERPEVNAPDKYHPELADQDTVSIGVQTWSEFAREQELKDLIDLGLKQNYDLLLAYERINESRAFVKKAKAGSHPTIDLPADVSRNKLSETYWLGEQLTQDGLSPWFNNYYAALAIGYEVDLWGKIRRSKESAVARMMATEAAQKTVTSALVTEIATRYYELLTLDEKLRIIDSNIALRQSTYDLIKQQYDQGIASGLALKQVEGVLYEARAFKPSIERQIAIQENALNLLLGRYPVGLARNGRLMEQDLVEELPSGIPSQLLYQRPDVIAVEMELVSKNADVGVARAAFYPSLTISATAGMGSADVSDWFDPKSLTGNLTAGLLAPIFRGGYNKGNLAAAESRKEQAMLDYQKTINTAFTEVSDALIAIDKLEDEEEERGVQVAANVKAAEYADDLYRQGVVSYLNVIEAQRAVLAVKLQYADVRQARLMQTIMLYKAVGGGWN